MGLRQILNKNPMLATGIAVTFVIIAAGGVWLANRAPGRPNGDLAFYTDDDGASFFVDSENLVPPFDHKGKTAVAAARYTYAGGSKNFCPNLAEYPPDVKKKLDDELADAKKQGLPAGAIKDYFMDLSVTGSMLVKRPLSNGPWVAASSPEGRAMAKPIPPDGGKDFDMMFP